MVRHVASLNTQTAHRRFRSESDSGNVGFRVSIWIDAHSTYAKFGKSVQAEIRKIGRPVSLRSLRTFYTSSPEAALNQSGSRCLQELILLACCDRNVRAFDGSP